MFDVVGSAGHVTISSRRMATEHNPPHSCQSVLLALLMTSFSSPPLLWYKAVLRLLRLSPSDYSSHSITATSQPSVQYLIGSLSRMYESVLSAATEAQRLPPDPDQDHQIC
jgi:hypothetical protein